MSRVPETQAAAHGSSYCLYAPISSLCIGCIGSRRSRKHRKGKTMATTFTNQAALSYNGGTVMSNIAVGVIEGNLTVSKEAIAQSYRIGDRITYVVSIVNSGDSAIGGLSVNDDLGAYSFEQTSVQPLTYADGSVQYYVDGVLQAAPAVSTADGLQFSGITVPANGNTMLVYEATVNEFASPEDGAEIINTVTVTGASISAVTDSATISVKSAPELNIIKTIAPIPVAENGEITYTFRLENSGNTALTAADNAVISDTFDPILGNISVTLNDEPIIVKSGYTYDEVTGLFTTVAGLVEVPAATFTQDSVTGAYSTTPGIATLVVTGTITGE